MIMLLNEIKKAVREGEEDTVKELVEQALAQKLQPRDVLEQAMMPAMQEIGEMFSRNEAFIFRIVIRG